MNLRSIGTALAGPRILSDMRASLVVTLVALPLCLGVAMASGVPPALGIITGVVGGLVVGFLAGSPFQVSGPAAGLTILVWDFVRTQEEQHPGQALARLGLCVFVAGGFQVAMGLAQAGQWFRAVTPAVVSGMLAGIGMLIFASQFHVLVDDQPRGGGWENLVAIPEAVRKGLVGDGTPQPHAWAARVGLLTVAALGLWKSLVSPRFHAVPAPLVAVALGTLVAECLGLGIARVDLPDLAGTLHILRPGDFGGIDTDLLRSALVIAFIASAETLLCAGAVDQMHRGPRTRYDQELTAQGVGNLVCGFLGVLPMTGVIVRSAANVEAGAVSRRAAVLHGLWLLLAAALLQPLIERVPTACLAAVLVYTGYKLMDPRQLVKLWRHSRSEAAICVATFAGVVAVDLLTGVLLGLALSALKLLHTFSHLSVRLERSPSGRMTVLRLEGAATFVRLPRLATTLEAVDPGTQLHVHFEDLTLIDHACLDLLMNWEKQHEATGGRLVVDWPGLTARFQPRHRRRVRNAG